MLFGTNGDEESQMSQRLTIIELMTNIEAAKKIKYKDYLIHYLVYNSYISNRFQVGGAERSKSATIYYSLFISQTIP